MNFFGTKQNLKFAAALAAALALGACAKNPTDIGALDTQSDAGGRGGAGGYGANGANGAASPGSQQDFALNVGDRVFFDSDSTELNATAQSTLDKQARWLNQYGTYAFTVEGHADERGTREYNFALGARRAEAAKNYLIARGIAASRIKTISYGKERPVAVCDDISCWSQNRRAVTVLKGGQS
jgi:peptidoglycan-associated lipoprotein